MCLALPVQLLAHAALACVLCLASYSWLACQGVGWAEGSPAPAEGRQHSLHLRVVSVLNPSMGPCTALLVLHTWPC